MSKRPASSPAAPKCPKRKNKTFTLEEKINILDELNAGAGCSTLGRRYGVNESTIISIRGNADKFRKAYAQPEIKNSTLHIREPTYKKMEEALKIWIEDMQMRQGFLTGPMIQTQALAIQEHLLVKEGKSASDMKFTASQGWLHNFIKRIDFQNLDPDDVEQLVQEMDAPLTVEDTVQLCEEAKGCEDDEEVKRKDTDPAIKDWSITTLQTLMTSMEETITIIKQNDPDMERVIQRVGALRRVISDYKTLLDRKICEQRQSSIKSYFTSSSGSADSSPPETESDGGSESLERNAESEDSQC